MPESHSGQENSSSESRYFGYPFEGAAPIRQPKEKPQSAEITTVQTLPGEKFLTYLPHDNFYQQKIALENAVLLAYYLNRSLILPPAYLGSLIEWDTFDAHYSLITSKNKQSKSYCSDISLRELASECLSYTAWTKVPWSTFFDLSKVKQYVRIYEEADFTYPGLMRYDIREEDIYFFKESVKYQHKFSDATTLRDGIKGHFQSLLHYSKLGEYDEKLLYVHSLNGRGRVQASHPDNYPVFQEMLKGYVWDNAGILQTAGLIIQKLGGEQNYLGIEVPTLELEFSDKISANLKAGLDVVVDNLLNSECEQPVGNRMLKAPSLDQCLMQHARNPCSSPILYLSTDAINPRAHVDFTPLFEQFPCTFTRHDFRAEFASLGVQLNQGDRINLAQHMISMVETEVVARGASAATTKKSMQGVYASLLHDIYYHKKSLTYTKIDFSH
ncbi:hypothetical protein K493DRAFT_314809 [Basidiobolus meristosporus CBS 931.73]|uniref:Uncharacterized protein n=1 Tax=Basidiobolus meristosporus CBS 931.73 TaxID=1314790 RepID=A0A1Y1YCU3_9FUNG|nr:hypothetical protein K493DRAFT_314809 [Basidiobolus meristosporus CBS 931.73]|eukprot:ORX95808.1 hypothetical protein K493DRAFT_314809 [Basidiobolus meristosporus CBS 931.73]